MKILVFSDIHGSLNSLKALIKNQDWICADMRIFLGDVCIGCSRPEDCIKLLSQLDCVKIVGNNDLYVCDRVPKADLADFGDGKFLQLEYMKAHVSNESKKIVLNWQKDLKLNINGKTFYFTHYPWETLNNEESVVETPKEKTFESRKQMFSNIDADYVFFGHEHRENNFSDGKQYFYCVGTLGLKSPGYYLTIDIEDDKIEIKDNYLPFNINEEIDLMDKAGYPYNKNKIARN